MLKLLLILAAAAAIATAAHATPLEFQDLSDADADLLLADVADELHSNDGLDLNDEFYERAHDDPETEIKKIDAPETDIKPESDPETETTKNGAPETDIKPESEVCDLGSYKKESGSVCESCPEENPATAYGIVGVDVCRSCDSNYKFSNTTKVCLNDPQQDQMEAQAEVVSLAKELRADETLSNDDTDLYIQFPEAVTNGRWKKKNAAEKREAASNAPISRVGQNANQFAKGVAKNVGHGLQNAHQFAKDVAKNVGHAVQNVHQFAKDVAKNVGNAIRNAQHAVGHAVQNVHRFAKHVAEHVGRAVHGAVRHVHQAVGRAAKFIHGAAKHVARGFGHAAGHLHRAAGRAVAHVRGAVGHAAKHVGNTLRSIGNHIGKFFGRKPKIGTNVRKGINKVRKVFGKVGGFFRRGRSGRRSPARRKVNSNSRRSNGKRVNKGRKVSKKAFRRGRSGRRSPARRKVNSNSRRSNGKRVNKGRKVSKKAFRRGRSGRRSPARRKVNSNLRQNIRKSIKQFDGKISKDLRRFEGFFRHSIQRTAGRHTSKNFQRRISKDAKRSVDKIKKNFRTRIDRDVEKFFGKWNKELRQLKRRRASYRKVISIRAVQETQSEDNTLQTTGCSAGQTCCLQGWYGAPPNCVQCPSNTPSSPRTASGGPDANCNCPNAAASSCFACPNRICSPFNVATGICTLVCPNCSVQRVNGVLKPKCN
jgi:hypothetical protein